jgi:hypothetical protein
MVLNNVKIANFGYTVISTLILVKIWIKKMLGKVS